MSHRAYHAIADFYDRINADIDYGAWADFIEENFRRHLKAKPELLLDLACGTGSMTLTLARRGYDMIGVDGSTDMLNIAMTRAREAGRTDILYLQQDMRAFELYGTVGAVTCCLDSINYLTEEGDLEACFATVHNYLDPDGLFLFDVNTPYKFEHIYATNAYILEDEIHDPYEDEELAADAGKQSHHPDHRAVYCGWQNFYDPATRLCDFDLTVFHEERDGRYRRAEESHTERCYTKEELTDALTRTDFELIGIHGGWDFSAPADDCERWYVVARAKKD